MIHLSHNSVLHNHIPLKRPTKGLRKISQLKIYMWAIYQKISPSKVICELFGLNQTSYLQDTCSLDILMNSKTGKFKGFDSIRTPAHISDELIKIDVIAYHDNALRVEGTTSTRKRTTNK